MKRNVLALLSGVFLFTLVITVDTTEPQGSDEIPLSDQTQTCKDCHELFNPGTVMDWMNSRHANSTPEEALKKPLLQRRVSSTTIPENLRSVAVGCYECHSLNPDQHSDNFEHFGEQINVIVSPNDCRICHSLEVEQYSRSKKAYAVVNLQKNPVFDNLVETILGVKKIENSSIVPLKASDLTKGETCFNCHGTNVTVAGMREISLDVGDVEVPELTNWPNQGVGRVNPDGSYGACTACHPRHGFSIEVARKPYTCSQCHLEPDVPSYNVYKESKHGNIFESKKQRWNWDSVPWKVGMDFRAPTCAVCHNSLITTMAGEKVAERTHNFGSRPWVRLFGVIYSHPQPKSGNTSVIVNKNGLPLPTTLAGEPAFEYLIDSSEQERRKTQMKKVCRSCHGTSWADGHFTQLDTAIVESDKMVLAATQLILEAWNKGVADQSNLFDEAIEQMWIEQWLFYANSIRYASAMAGPDYASFKNGWWKSTHNLQVMRNYIEGKRQ